MTFYGSSFIADFTGAKVAEADRTSQTVLTHTFDLDDLKEKRSYWGIFRDRRPEVYDRVISLDGKASVFGK
jgi:N-carbamoylputrescine amidase